MENSPLTLNTTATPKAGLTPTDKPEDFTSGPSSHLAPTPHTACSQSAVEANAPAPARQAYPTPRKRLSLLRTAPHGPTCTHSVPPSAQRQRSPQRAPLLPSQLPPSPPAVTRHVLPFQAWAPPLTPCTSSPTFPHSSYDGPRLRGGKKPPYASRPNAPRPLPPDQHAVPTAAAAARWRSWDSCPVRTPAAAPCPPNPSRLAHSSRLNFLRAGSLVNHTRTTPASTGP